MPHRHGDGAAPDEAPSPRPAAGGGCYGFLLTRSHRAGAYRRLRSSAPEAAAAAVRVEVGTASKAGRARRSVFHVDPAVLEAGPVRRLLAAAGRRAPGGGVAVDVDALLFEHLLWLATTNKGRDGVVGGAGTDAGGEDDDLSDIVEFYSEDGDEDRGPRSRASSRRP